MQLVMKCSSLHTLFDTASQNLAFSLGHADKSENLGFQLPRTEEDSGSCCIQKMLCLIVWLENLSDIF